MIYSSLCFIAYIRRFNVIPITQIFFAQKYVYMDRLVSGEVALLKGRVESGLAFKFGVKGVSEWPHRNFRVKVTL